MYYQFLSIRKIITATFILFGFLSMGWATDGYFSMAYDAKGKGLAGGGVGLYEYSLIGGNPAGLSFLGDYKSVGINFFMPLREYTVTGNPSGLPGTFGLAPGNVQSGNNVFPVPSAGFNWAINETSAWGIAVFANGGMNTSYDTPTFGDASAEKTGVNLMQLFTTISYSKNFAEKHSVGLGIVLAGQSFSATGLNNFAPFSQDASALSNNGSNLSFGAGLKIGYLGMIVDQVWLGASFQTKTYMSSFDDYAGLFAGSGDFDVPMQWSAGIAYEASSKLNLFFDVKQILYSDIPSVGNPVDPAALPPAFLNPGGDPNNPADYTANPNHVPLGDDKGSGFGWEDMMILKAGFDYDMNENWTLRSAYSYGQQPIPESEVLFNILAPGTVENHFAVGLSKKLESGKSLDFSLIYVPNRKVSGFNPFDFDPVASDPSQGMFVPNQTIDLEMYQFEIGIGYNF